MPDSAHASIPHWQVPEAAAPERPLVLAGGPRTLVADGVNSVPRGKP